MYVYTSDLSVHDDIKIKKLSKCILRTSQIKHKKKTSIRLCKTIVRSRANYTQHTIRDKFVFGIKSPRPKITRVLCSS